MTLLGGGYFVRGAIVKGPLYQDDKMVFCEALVRAYCLDSDIVRYPRIMITGRVVDDSRALVDDSDHGGLLLEVISNADDGPRFLNILFEIGFVLRHEAGAERARQLGRFNAMADGTAVAGIVRQSETFREGRMVREILERCWRDVWYQEHRWTGHRYQYHCMGTVTACAVRRAANIHQPLRRA